MKKNSLLLIVLTVFCLCPLVLYAEKNYEGLDFKKLRTPKKHIYGKSVMLKAGLGEIDSGSFVLEDKGITPDKYKAVKLYRPGKTKEMFNAYLAKDSDALAMYKNYGTGERLKRTREKGRGINVWGTVYYTSRKKYPVAMVIDKVQFLRTSPKGNLKYSITVSHFENKANWQGKWSVGDGFVEIMTNALQESGYFIVLGDKQMRKEALAEQDFGKSGRTAKGKKTPKIGRMTPAQLLVKGAITHVQNKTSGGLGGINIRGIRLGGSKGRAEINITIYLVNSETGQVAASTKVVGKSDRKGVSAGYYGRGPVTGGASGYKNDNVGKACEDAVAQAVDFLIKQLKTLPWQGSIVLAKPGKIIINRGKREGVQVGQQFTVGSVEELVDEDTGEVLDTEVTKAGTIEVTKLKEKIAYCKALEGGDKIKKGMTVTPME